ncbi:MAG: PTS system mannose/fructose/sorbose family transporter subunit IID [Erysipelotrichaceae bacterium]
MAPKKLKKSTLFKSYLNWSFFHLASLGFERMEAFGFLHSMMPIIKELYPDNKEEELAALKRHAVFYNVEPILGTVVPGIVAALEENRANGAKIDDAMINGVKVGLMGPLSGIGDSFFQGLFTPILLSIGISLAVDGSPVGPIFYIITALTFIIFFSYFVYFRGYKLGINSVGLFLGDNSKRVQEAFTVLGLIVTGAIGAKFVGLSLNINILSDGSVTVQTFLNNLFPNLLPLLLLVSTWYLRVKKQVKPTTLIIAYVILAFLGVAAGIL